jgi:hypothetical protein
VAVPSVLVAEARWRFVSGADVVRSIIAQHQATSVLESVDSPDEKVLERVDELLVNLGKWVLSEDRWKTLDAPQGYERGPVEPWIAFATPESDGS